MTPPSPLCIECSIKTVIVPAFESNGEADGSSWLNARGAGTPIRIPSIMASYANGEALLGRGGPLAGLLTRLLLGRLRSELRASRATSAGSAALIVPPLEGFLAWVVRTLGMLADHGAQLRAALNVSGGRYSVRLGWVFGAAALG